MDIEFSIVRDPESRHVELVCVSSEPLDSESFFGILIAFVQNYQDMPDQLFRRLDRRAFTLEH